MSRIPAAWKASFVNGRGCYRIDQASLSQIHGFANELERRPPSFGLHFAKFHLLCFDIVQIHQIDDAIAVFAPGSGFPGSGWLDSAL